MLFQIFDLRRYSTETLVPADCTAFMAHSRVPVRSSAAALLLNRLLTQEHAMHVMAFSLPARKHLGEVEPTHWVRPCMQLFVHREDVRALGAAVLRLAVGVEAAAKLGSHWLAKTREVTTARRAALEAETASFLDQTAAHNVTVGFSVPVPPPGAFARKDSAVDLTQPISKDGAEAGAEAESAVGDSLGASASGAGGVAAAVAAVAKYSAAQQVHTPQLGHTEPRSSFFLPALPEDREESAAEIADSFAELALVGSLSRGVNFNYPNVVGVNSKGGGGGVAVKGGVSGGGHYAQSPMSIMDLGSSVASSMGTSLAGSVDGAGFMVPDWFNRRDNVTPVSVQPQQHREGF